MKYQVTASPIRGQKIEKTVDGVRELRDYLAECREMDYSVKSVRRAKQAVVQSTKGLQLA